MTGELLQESASPGLVRGASPYAHGAAAAGQPNSGSDGIELPQSVVFPADAPPAGVTSPGAALDLVGQNTSPAPAGDCFAWANRTVAEKPCRNCNLMFQPFAGGSLYCSMCRPVVKRKKHALGARTWRAKDPERHATYQQQISLKKYGLTIPEYRTLLEKQGNACAICGTTEPGGRGVHRKFAIDHCHSTGYVRGLLCHHCNTGIGLFNESPSVLRAAEKYVSNVGIGDAFHPHFPRIGAVACIEISEHLCANLAQALQYVWRAPYKGRMQEDLAKARWFIVRECARRQRMAGAYLPTLDAHLNQRFLKVTQAEGDTEFGAFVSHIRRAHFGAVYDTEPLHWALDELTMMVIPGRRWWA